MPYKDKQARTSYSSKYAAQRRSDWIASQGGFCNHCGDMNGPFDVDHIEPASKEWRVAIIWTRNAELRETELAKCQVLCRPCHKLKTRNERFITDWKHGTRTAYMSRGCRCQPCKTWNTERKKKRA